jgi:hypothetical protein
VADAEAIKEAMVHARGLLADAHHGLREGEAIGHASALAEVYQSAQACGATPADLDEIRAGFPVIARALLHEHRGRRRWRPGRGSEQRGLPPFPRPPELPPGS